MNPFLEHFQGFSIILWDSFPPSSYFKITVNDIFRFAGSPENCLSFIVFLIPLQGILLEYLMFYEVWTGFLLAFKK